jgi:hypothetical protein
MFGVVGAFAVILFARPGQRSKTLLCAGEALGNADGLDRW